MPRHHRGEIWKFLAEQYHLKHPFPCKQQPKDTPYKELLKQLTSQQHAILIDLGKPAVSLTWIRKPHSLGKSEETVQVIEWSAFRFSDHDLLLRFSSKKALTSSHVSSQV